VALFQEREGHFAAGVVGVGHQVEGGFQSQVEKQPDQLVQQGAAPAVGEHEAFVNAAGQRDGQTAAHRLDQHRHGLAGMAPDEGGLGVARRLLVQTLDGRHFLSLLGRFESVGQQNHAIAGADQASGKDAGDQGGPGADELGQVQGGRGKEAEEARGAPGPQPVTAHQAGGAGQAGAGGQGGAHDDQPEEGAGAGAGGAQGGDGLIPNDPEVHGRRADWGLDIADSRNMLSATNATASIQKLEQRIQQLKAELAALGGDAAGKPIPAIQRLW
jgi:hypothetical protein